MQERLQKIISRAGVASRRKAEELITQGMVSVNGHTVTELGSKAEVGKDHIKVRGKLLRPVTERIYLAMHKPKGCVTTTSDPEGRETVMDLLGLFRTKVYPVGRLDFHSEGLLLFTNDGDFANYILSAKNGISKTYQVKVNGTPSTEQLEKFRNGIFLDGRMTAPCEVRPLKPGENPWYEVVLREGRQNQIRRMFQSLGFLVEKLKRVRVGPLQLGSLPPAHFRELTGEEVKRLMSPPKPDAPAKTSKPVKTWKRTQGAKRTIGSQPSKPAKKRKAAPAKPSKPGPRTTRRVV